jgi:putative FmdB family regulatory protein
MPIHEFNCRACGHQFEALVRKTTVVACPDCQSSDLEQLFSLPVVRSESTRQRVTRDVRQRDSRQAAERDHAQRLYEASHDD